MTITFAPATKKALKARIAIEGPSGSGKTWTSLLFAQALGNKIALIDTERRSASLYADVFTFDTAPIDDNYHPDRLIEALASAASGGYDVVIVDSWSHFWMGQGGMLEAVDQAGKRSGGGNNFAGWKEMRPTERKMVDAMLAYPGHLITTLRVKTDYVVEENDRGKKVPKKVGMKAEQREGLEYEFTLVGAMDLDLTLVVSKSRCPLLSGAVVNKPTEEFARTLLSWLDDGESAGQTAVQIRDELLANPSATLDEIRGYRNRARAAGVLGSALIDEHGDATTLDAWIIARGNAAQASVTAAQQPAPAITPEAASEPAPASQKPMVTQAQHRRMHALWNELGYAGDANRDERLAITSRILKRSVDSSATLTEDEAEGLIAALESKKRELRNTKPAQAEQQAPATMMTAAQRDELFAELRRTGLDADRERGLTVINEAIAPARITTPKQLTEFQAAQAIAALKALVPV